MVSNTGAKLSNPYPISGFGIHHYRHHPTLHHGRGPIRRITGSIVGTIGHALVNKLASAISGNGSGWKPTGTGIRRHRRPRHTLTHIGGYRRVGRPRTRKPRTNHSISTLLGSISGYRRRRPRNALSGMGRKRIHRKILLI